MQPEDRLHSIFLSEAANEDQTWFCHFLAAVPLSVILILILDDYEGAFKVKDA